MDASKAIDCRNLIRLQMDWRVQQEPGFGLHDRHPDAHAAPPARKVRVDDPQPVVDPT
jgi:hypothetical protein